MTAPAARPNASPRAATVVRETRETQIRVALGGDPARVTVDTSEPFLDHMLVTLARYAGLGLTIHARGDLKHHLIEDVGIAMGEAVRAFAPATAARYGERTIPMDDALVHACLDLGGRPWYKGPLPARLYDHWMQSFAVNARATLHMRVLRGHDRHHVVEAGFKALGMALREALAESGAVFSTKGAVETVVDGGAPDDGAPGDGAPAAGG